MQILSKRSLRRRRQFVSLAAVSIAAGSNLSHAALTVATFGSGFALSDQTNYSPNTPPTSSVLADVTTVQNTDGSSTSLSITAGGAGNVTLGAIAFDLSAGSGINLDASSGTAGAAALTLAGGNIGTTTPATNNGDLITLTSNVNGLVDFRGSNGGLTLNVPTAGGNFNVASNSTLELDALTTLAGAGSITLTGAGTVLINNAEGSYGGGTGFVVNGGTLTIGTNSNLSLGKNNTTTTIGGGAINFLNALTTTTGGTHPFVLNAGNDTIGVASSTGSITLSGLVSGAGTLVKSGNGILFLNAQAGNTVSNSFSGGITINAGSLLFGTTNDLGAPANLITFNGGTLAYADTATALAIPSAHTYSLLANGGTVNVATGTLQFNGVVAGGGAIAKTGAGTLILSATNNTFTGGAILSAGTLSFPTLTSFGASTASTPDAFTINGGTLNYTGASGNSTLNRPYFIGANGGAISVAAAATNLTLNGPVTPVAQLATPGALNILGPGTLTFNGIGTTGVPIVVGPASGSGVAVAAFSGGTPAIASLASSGFGVPSVVLGFVSSVNGTGNLTTLSVGSDNTNTAFSGIISDQTGTTATAIGAITKVGNGAITLSGPNTYTGGTLINGGRVSANNASGSATGTGPVTAGDGNTNAGVLGGTGTVAGSITANSNGTIAPGTTATVAALTGGGSLTLHAGSTLITKLASASSYDSVALSNAGSLTFDASGTVNLSLISVAGFTPTAASRFNIITFPTAETVTNFTSSSFVISSYPANFDVSGASIQQDANDIYITGLMAATPEPGTCSIIAFAGVSTLLRRRRRA